MNACKHDWRYHFTGIPENRHRHCQTCFLAEPAGKHCGLCVNAEARAVYAAIVATEPASTSR